MFLTIIAFIGVLAVLVLVHELGHFWTAKKTGMDVEEFGFGFPPRVASFTKNGTRYSLNLLPLGGFVKIRGENGEDDTSESSAGTQTTGSFSSKPAWARLLVLSAGVIMNILLAWVLLSAAFALGAPQAVDGVAEGNQTNQRVMIREVQADSPAAAAGIKAGDTIVQIDGQPMTTVTDVQSYTSAHAGQSITYLINREGESLTLSLTPRQNPPAGQGATGVGLLSVADVSYSIPESLWRGAQLTWEYFVAILTGFGTLIKGLFGFGPSVANQVAGPVGIAAMTGEFARMGAVALMQFMAMLSINLAILNALPIPALDGGRIVFVLLEAIRGKKVRAAYEQWSHAIGFAALLLLMALVTFMDIAKHI